MMNKPEAETIREYHDHKTKEVITLKQITYSDGVRYQVKWKHQVESDYEVDFTEFQTLEEAGEAFLQYIRTYVLHEQKE